MAPTGTGGGGVGSCRRCWELTRVVPPGCDILQADDLETWIIKLSLLGETVYAGGEPEGERRRLAEWS